MPERPILWPSARLALALCALAAAPIAALHLALGIELAAPIKLALGSFAALLLVLAMLRRAARPQRTSTLGFWRGVASDLESSTNIERLRRHRLLLIQLSLLAWLVYALAEPRVSWTSLSRRSLCVIVDVSASMAARDRSGLRRLDHATRELEALIDGLGPDERMQIISAAGSARTLQPWSGRKTLLRKAVEALRIDASGGRLEGALRLAVAALRDPAAQGELIIVTDGGLTPPTRRPRFEGEVRLIEVGQPDDNVAITRAAVTLGDDGGPRRVFVTVGNYGRSAASLTVTLRSPAGLLAAREQRVEAGLSQSLVLRPQRLPPGPVTVSLRGLDDALPEDDIARLVVPARPLARVALIGAIDPSLRAALRADERVRFVAPGVARPELIVFGDSAPIETSTSTLLYCQPRAVAGRVELGRPLAAGVIDAWDSSDPLLRHALPNDVAIGAGRGLRLGEEVRSIMERETQTVLAAWHQGSLRVMFGFPLSASNWPLRLSFPVFVRNLVSATIEDQRPHPSSVVAGRPVLLRAPPSGRLTVTSPDGVTHELPLGSRPAWFDDTAALGVYAIRAGARESYFRVNLSDPEESRLDTRGGLDSLRASGVESRARPRQSGLHRYAIFIVLALLLLEFAAWRQGR